MKYILIILYLIFISIIKTNEIKIINKLTFLLIGDWGKGGINGDIRTISNNNININNKNDNNNNNNNNLIEVDYNRLLKDNGGNNKNQRKVYTYQIAIASTMSKWILKNNITPEFILSLGDNFYDNGVTSVDDSLWITNWRDVYLKNFTNLRIPWYPVLGNHDYGYGNQGIQAQLSRTKTLINDISNGLWQFPSTNYSKLFSIPGGGSLGIIFVDTTTLAPSQNKCCNENGGVSIEEQQIRISNQISRLHLLFQEILLYNPTWLLVVGHYPIFSRGEHGDISELKEYLLPLLIQYNVTAYICGHDHISEHLQASNIDFFVAGAGSMTSSLYNTETESQLIWSGVGYSSFAAIDATTSTLKISYIRSDETIVYNYTISTPHSSLFQNYSKIRNDDINNDDNDDNDNGNNDDIKDNDDIANGVDNDDKNNSSESNFLNLKNKVQIITITASIGGVLGIISLGIIMFYRKYHSKDFKLLSMNSPLPPKNLSSKDITKKNKLSNSYKQTRFQEDNYDIEKQQSKYGQFTKSANYKFEDNDSDDDEGELNGEKIIKLSQLRSEATKTQKLSLPFSTLKEGNMMKINEGNGGGHKKAKSMPI